MKASRTHFYLKGCTHCGGDLLTDEEGDLVCLQCGRAASRSVDRTNYASAGSALQLSDQDLAAALSEILDETETVEAEAVA